ncbi:hypothetical protein GCG54_00005264 [Colletotrichum gloeosporioides]|uniref:DUF6536 domain-containing protein n=1 Tax=Colletotrichum gloeosporioides TaxID=474922 RepID=A0A8H4CTE7_COLGL|nr:uncharacterized protein GCG54_00005264 [Colletotrichum gloeosporioides]KAF3809723.1 hypothetical protein GCG54_00005264 [Colletotrichum gloeosporioides]
MVFHRLSIEKLYSNRPAIACLSFGNPMPSVTNYPRLSRLSRVRLALPTGWRRAAIVNICLMSICFLVLLSILIAAISKTGNVAQVWKFYTADCRSRGSSVTNTMLHLLLNILSTIILASSGFFMQVLNSPSRTEVDETHATGNWLDIGIPSWRNAFRLSRFKLWSWIILFLSSVPIHVFFNSSIFQIDSRMGDFHLTIATESFVKGEPFFLPGASLYTDGLFSNYTRHEGLSNVPPFGDVRSYDFKTYLTDRDSTDISNVSKAAEQGLQWQRLSTTECRALYSGSRSNCKGLREYRNAILVCKGSGWKRSELWNLSNSANALWEPVVPSNEINTLWLSTPCTMKGIIVESNPQCENTCGGIVDTLSSSGHWQIRTFDWYETSSTPEFPPVGWNFTDLPSWSMTPRWNSTLYAAPGNESTPTFGYRDSSYNLEIDYCLAEPRDLSSACGVALSKPLLLAVVVSVLIKIIACIVTIHFLGSEEPLVTPGDAIASFISKADVKIDQPGFSNPSMFAKVKKRKKSYVAYEHAGPTQWVNTPRKTAACISSKAWISTYAILGFGVVVAIACCAKQLTSSIPLRWIKTNPAESNSVLSAIDGGVAFISSVLVANVPQLYLSFWYLAYNTLITRMEMAREWSRFSTGYRSLRVSSPRGQQIDTYRLQLPYRQSIPLITASIVLHWLLSNSLFVIVSQGNYFEMSLNRSDGGYKGDPISLPPNTVVGLGTASLPVLLLAVIGGIMMIIPIFLSRKQLAGYMPIVGSNSMAMAAACRVSPIAKIPTRVDDKDDKGQATELEELRPTSSIAVSEEGLSAPSQSTDMPLFLLRWGEVEMPKSWYERVGMDGQEAAEIGHLSFGTVLDDPKPPKESRFYV